MSVSSAAAAVPTYRCWRARSNATAPIAVTAGSRPGSVTAVAAKAVVAGRASGRPVVAGRTRVRPVASATYTIGLAAVPPTAMDSAPRPSDV